MSARTRRGLALSWSALFVLSMLLQYFSFALASPALAVHDEGLFELDGNTVNNPAVLGDDWDSHPGATGNRSLFITDVLGAGDNIFTGGASKDDLNTTGWKWTIGTVQDKNDIEHAFAVSYDKDGHSFIYFGLDRYSNNGDAYTGFWFFKNGIATTPAGGFAPAHSVGDLLVQADFTNGGATSTINLYEWVGSGGDTNGTLNKLATGQVCTGAPVADKACAVTNSGPIDPSWSFDDKGTPGADNLIPAEAFFEGGIDLDDLFGGNAPCFSSFLAETRSSQSVDSTLSDFATGAFNTCVPPTLTTDASVSTWHFGDAGVTDLATLSGTDGPASGKVKFFVCTPAQITGAGCPAGVGTQIGVAAGVTVTTSANGGTATSTPAYVPTAVGEYCFRAEYVPDAASEYLAASHTNATTECFTVVKNNTTITTSANQTVNIGATISDSATLTGATSDAGGSITFRAYGPGNATCTGTAAFTSDPVAVSGNGTYGPVSFTPTTAGVYRWIATYSGDAKNEGSTHACGAAGETDTVNKVDPTITTQASAAVLVGGNLTDTATVAGGHNPTGTVTFRLYGPNDATCANAAIFTSADRPLTAGVATSAAFTTTQVGTYRWIATYNGDANNTAVSGACNDANENVVVNPRSPSIATQLVGGGKQGASITVPLGTAVHDTSTLTGATANAGGTVHYQVFGNAQCTGTATEAGTIAVVNGVPGNSTSITFNHAGTYYWQADYSGDANNDPATSACNLEIVTVDKDIPAIVTNASADVTIGGSISDSATLSNGTLPTGTITFSLYGPNNATCTGTAIFSSVVQVNAGNATYQSGSFTPTAVGTYRWIAVYSGDGDNASVSGACGDANEDVDVNPANPTVTTNASASVTVGGAIFDTATLAGGVNPTGSITFSLYGPDNATCTGDAIFTSTKTVTGNGQYVSASYTTTAAGTYRWIANYGGDANNTATANACNAANENVVVTKANPTVTTNASASVTVGGAIFDTATLSGGYSPTGTITFELYGPDNATCTGEPIFTDTATVTGNGDYVSDSYTTTQAGTYRWIANYGGDANNTATANACNAANENVDVTKDNPDIATVATEGAQVGDQVHDVATVTGGYNPTGTVTFRLYAPSDPNCDGSAVFTDTVALGADGTATSGNYTVTVMGNYHWVASYSGDDNNESATGACGDEGETTQVRQYNPEITTVLTSGDVSGAKITVLFGSSVTDQATLTGASATAGGTVTYAVYLDSDCTIEFAGAGSKTVTNGVVPVSNAVVFPDAGTYYWQASYSGDAANAAAISPCTDEILTVTTPQLHAVKQVKTNDGTFGDTSTAEPGDTLTFQITVSNTGDAVATNVPVSDDIADILAHATYNDDCSDSCSLVGSELQWTIPSIAIDGSEVLTFSVTLDDSFPAGTTHLPNAVVVVGPGSNCPEASEDPDCDTDTTVEAQPDLDVTKLVATGDSAFGPTSTANPGDTLNFQITITNTGNADATNVPVSDDIAAVLAHATYNDDCSNGCTVDGTTLNWTIPSLAANGGSVTLTFSVTLDDSFPQGTTHLPNVVVVTGPGSNCPEASEDPDCDTDTTVEAQPDLDVTKLVATGVRPFGPTSLANPGDVLNYQITISNTGNAPATNVPVSDDIAALLAHATYNDDCSNGCTVDGSTLNWTIASIAAGGSVTLTFSVTLDATFPAGTTTLPNVVVVTGPGSNCPEASEDPDCDTTTTVTESILSIDKSFTGNTAGTDPDLNVPAANIGDTLTYTLHYTGDGPLVDAVITDVLPQGFAYIVGSAEAGDDGSDFDFVGYDEATRTLTWIGNGEGQSIPDPADGDVTYQVTVLATAPDFAQPLVNVATIVAFTPERDELTDSDTAQVAVLAPPLGLTPPPTSTLTPQSGTSNPGFALMLILLGVAGLTLGIGFITPVPARVRRRERLG